MDLLVVERVEGVLVERRQRRYCRRQHRHRVRVAREAVEELAQLLVQHRVALDVGLEVGQLRRGRELAVDEQVGDLGKARLRRELLDRVAAVAQDARVTVDVGDRRLARRRVGEPGIQGHRIRRLEQRRDVEPVIADGGRHAGQGQIAARVGEHHVGHSSLQRTSGRRGARAHGGSSDGGARVRYGNGTHQPHALSCEVP